MSPTTPREPSRSESLPEFASPPNLKFPPVSRAWSSTPAPDPSGAAGRVGPAGVRTSAEDDASSGEILRYLHAIDESVRQCRTALGATGALVKSSPARSSAGPASLSPATQPNANERGQTAR